MQIIIAERKEKTHLIFTFNKDIKDKIKIVTVKIFNPKTKNWEFSIKIIDDEKMALDEMSAEYVIDSNFSDFTMTQSRKTCKLFRII